jgi:hypothetical protein
LNNIDEAWRLRNEIKKDMKEIMEMNLVYVDNNKTRPLYQSDKLPRIEKQKTLLKVNEKKLGNFKYITGNVSAQLMRAFLNFNPIIHLNNLKNLLAKADPEIQQDIKALNNIIDKDIEDILDPRYYRKKFEKLQERARRQREGSSGMKQSFSEDSRVGVKDSGLNTEEKFMGRNANKKISIKMKNGLMHHESKNFKKKKEKIAGIYL